GQGDRVGRGPARDARAGDRAIGCRAGDAGDRAARLARAGRADVGRAGADRRAHAAVVGGGRAGLAHAGRPGRPVDAGPGRVGLPQPQHPVRRTRAAGPGGGDLPARRADRLGREGGAVIRPALLVLEDGRTFRGEAFGAVGESVGEAVFATGMTGYQETLTDPSYHRQVVVMTAPHVGNTGINDEDAESARIWVAGYVVPAVGTRRLTVAALDLGIKANTPRMMAERGIETHVLPATASLDEVLAV